MGLGKEAIGIANAVERGANGDEMGEDLVGLMETMAEEVGVNLSEMGSRFVAVKKAEDSPLDLHTVLAHVIEERRRSRRRRKKKK